MPTLQANVDPRAAFEDWDLQKLADKMRQYCPLLEHMSGDSLKQVILKFATSWQTEVSLCLTT